MLVCMAGAVLVSVVGAVLAGQPGMDAAATPVARRLGLMIAFGALASVFGVAYLRAVREARWGDLSTLRTGALAVHAVAALALPLTSNDLFSNLAYGRIAALGGNPYRVGPSSLPGGDPFAALVSARWIDTPIVYGPLIARLDALAASVGSVPLAMAAYKLLLLGCAVGVVLLAYRLCRELGDGAASVGDERSSHDMAGRFALVALAPVLVWEVSAQAHNDGVPVLAMAGALALALGGRLTLATLLLSGAAFAKHAALPVLALHLAAALRNGPRRALLLVGLCAGVGVVLFLPYWDGLATLRGPLVAALGAPGRTARSLIDLACLVTGPLGPEATALTYRVLSTLTLLPLMFLGLRALLRVRTVFDVAHEGLVLLLVWCLTTPWFQPWYVTWLLPLTLLERNAGTRRAVALFAALSVAQYLLPIDPITNVAIDALVLWRLWRAGAFA